MEQAKLSGSRLCPPQIDISYFYDQTTEASHITQQMLLNVTIGLLNVSAELDKNSTSRRIELSNQSI